MSLDGFKVDLSSHKDKYANGSLELGISKKVNFIFGKNGTGKTTISDEILAQLSDEYSVHVFKDFDGVATNERLDAVALGTENAAIQKKIDIVNGEIASIGKDLEKPVDDNAQNLYSLAISAKKKYDDQNTKIDRFYSSAASEIKSQRNPQISGPNYDRTSFKPEISKAKALTDEELSTHKDTIKADKKPDIELVKLPSVNLAGYLQSTNEILSTRVTQSSILPELSGSPKKQQFARIGMDTHEHKTGEVCAFCGSEITDERWIALGNHFNDEVKKLESRIELGVQLIEQEIVKLDSTKEANLHHYYGKYAVQIEALNTTLKLRKAEHRAYLNDLKKALEDKRNNLFVKNDPLEPEAIVDFTAVQDDYTELITDNNKFSKDLESEQNKSRDALRYCEIQKKIDTFKFSDESALLVTLDALNNAARDELQKKQKELSDKQTERADLILQTKDEKKIAIKINDLLKNMGVTSFELELVNDESENQKGQYQIKGHNGIVRPVTALSKGEKNIIALLYFMLDLERADSQGKPRIVVLDDPMTSNDDTMQYIMINEIQKHYGNVKDGNYFILLTHNVHFYLNVRPNTGKRHKVKIDGEYKEISFYEKYGVLHLFSDGKLSTIKVISKGNYDFKTSYETLWKELSFLYNADDATPDLMLGPSRKICETYMHFSKKEIDVFYGENRSAKKLFDVNQHSIDDLEAEMNGKTKSEIKDLLKELFTQNGAEDHFNSYWKENES